MFSQFAGPPRPTVKRSAWAYCGGGCNTWRAKPTSAEREAFGVGQQESKVLYGSSSNAQSAHRGLTTRSS